jgi:uncharacterized protein (TIGR03032 family)
MKEIKSSLVYSTYQAGKLIFISSLNGTSIVKYAKNFKRPMGLAYDPETQKLAIASKSAVDIFSTSKGISYNYPDALKKYDSVFLPQASFNTGILDTHEIGWFDKKLWIVNTMFSNLASMDDGVHFKKEWQPQFITEMMPEDRCHLNGLCFENGKPQYVTCFSDTDHAHGWKDVGYEQGKLINIDTNEIEMDGLAMPHSPIIIGDDIYIIQSATGEVLKHNRKTKERTVLNQFNTFLRGMEIYGDYIFIGASKIREGSTSFKNLPIDPEDSFCGIIVLDKNTGDQVASLNYTDHIKEIFSVKILPGVRSPALLTDRDDLYNKAVMAEGMNFWVKMKENQKESAQK